jgi:hypothetical protein
VWKRLDESISTSEKWAKLSWSTMGIGMYILANSDSKGRYDGDSRVIRARCMTYREDVRLEIIEGALSELERERVLHVYHVGQKRYIVFHDCLEWNPPGALRYQAPKYPDPPSELCECLRRESGVKAPLVTSRLVSSTSEGVEGEVEDEPPVPRPSVPVVSARDEVIRQLFQLARKQSIAATASTLRGRLESWVARIGAQAVQEKLSSPSAVGKTVNELHDLWFPKVQQKALAPAVKTFKCATCADTGKLPDGRGGSSPCSCTRRRAGA